VKELVLDVEDDFMQSSHLLQLEEIVNHSWLVLGRATWSHFFLPLPKTR
jgi:hypothetical protein